MAYMKKDILIGCILALFAVGLHLVVIPEQVASHGQGPVALSPRLFCHITAGLLLMLSLILVLTGIREKKEDLSSQDPAKDTRILQGIASVVLSAVYIVFINQAGYFVSTAFFMVIFLLGFGARGFKGILIFLAVILPFIYFLFTKLLKVILPSGIMF